MLCMPRSSREHPAAHGLTKHLGQVISLGTHVVSPEWPRSMMVFEVMPSVLAKRTFPPLATARMLVPGYRDSPDPGQDMAIVYIKVGPVAACCHRLSCQDDRAVDHMVRRPGPMSCSIQGVPACQAWLSGTRRGLTHGRQSCGCGAAAGSPHGQAGAAAFKAQPARPSTVLDGPNWHPCWVAGAPNPVVRGYSFQQSITRLQV